MKGLLLQDYYLMKKKSDDYRIYVHVLFYYSAFRLRLS